MAHPGDAHELCSGEIADGGHERGATHLLLQHGGVFVGELPPAVHRDAPCLQTGGGSATAELSREPRDGGWHLTKVGVDMGNATSFTLANHQHCFHQLKEAPEETFEIGHA